MLKAQYILKCLLANRRLKSVCKLLNVSYKYIYSITTGLQNASANVQTGLYPIIFPSFWFDEATPEFCKLYKEKITSLETAYLLEKPENISENNSMK